MQQRQLPNYLRANRKRLGLSQKDVAFLLGGQSGAKISKYENFSRTPSLEAALALEAIHKRSVSELFGGLYQKAEGKVAKRAKTLLDRKPFRQDGRSAQKRKTLSQLVQI